jgi:two-component system CheB/CheR fusion protein
MTREGLFLELRNALEESKRMNAEVRRERVQVRTDATIREINLRVLPVRLPGSSESCYLILFEEPGAPALPRAAQSSSREASAAAAEPPAAEGQGFFGRLRRWLAPLPDPGGPSPSEQEIRQLRQELAATREYLQSVIEQQDAANEELKSANEEILSSNEELQSTNEELETAKEELQSVNEELTTINEQLQTRNADLSRLNDDLANLLGSANVPMVVLGIDLRIRRFTPAAGRLLNLLPTDVGRPISNLKLTIEVSDLESMVTGVIDTVRVVEREIRDLHGHWYDLRIHPYRTADNKIDGAVVVLQDIDQLKRAQEELQRQATQLRRQTSLIELSQDAIIVRDTTDVIVFWNRGAQEMYGWSRDEALGKKTHELLQTTCANTPDGMDAQLLKDGEWEGELGQTRRGGTPLIVYSRQVLVREKGETPPAILEINRDITERKRTEQLLQQQAEALRQADRRKNEFLATLAHELRNPLSPIVNALQILRLENNDPSRLVAMRDMLERQTQQLSRIVEDLLDMTRIVEGKIELRKERVALSQAVATALESSRSLIDRSGHQLTVKLPAEPVYVEADPVRLAQILTNLLNNAAKFTETGGQIWLTARRDVGSRPPGEVIISVRDSGIGIAPELLPHIFEMFTQGDRSLGRTRSGLGVGLALVHSLVRMHGGFIEAQSEGPGKGSEFIVHLPLAPEPSPLMGPPAPPPAAASVLQPGTSQAGPFPSRRILVVDDNHDQAQTLGMLLELMGYEVHVEHDGPSAVRAALKMIPEVALIDICLPGMNGYEVARELRQHPELEHMVLVAQTGWGQEEDRQRSRAAGFDYHLVKPVDHLALQNVLKAHRGE